MQEQELRSWCSLLESNVIIRENNKLYDKYFKTMKDISRHYSPKGKGKPKRVCLKIVVQNKVFKKNKKREKKDINKTKMVLKI